MRAKYQKTHMETLDCMCKDLKCITVLGAGLWVKNKGDFDKNLFLFSSMRVIA